MDDSLEILIGEWHALTDQEPELIESRFMSDGTVLLERVVSEAMGSSFTGEFSSPSEFAQYVIDLRDNERAWSRQLGNVILAAQSWLDHGNREAAKGVFSEFEANCPWKMFVDIARTQRLNTLGEPGSGSITP